MYWIIPQVIYTLQFVNVASTNFLCMLLLATELPSYNLFNTCNITSGQRNRVLHTLMNLQNGGILILAEDVGRTL